MTLACTGIRKFRHRRFISARAPFSSAFASAAPCAGKIPISSAPCACAVKPENGVSPNLSVASTGACFLQMQVGILEHHGQSLAAAHHQEGRKVPRTGLGARVIVAANEADDDLTLVVAQSEASQPSIFCLSSMPGGPALVAAETCVFGERGRGAGIAGASGSVTLSMAMSKVLPQAFSQFSASCGRLMSMGPESTPAPSERSRTCFALPSASSAAAASPGWKVKAVPAT